MKPILISFATFAVVLVGVSSQAHADPYSDEVKKEFMTGCTAQAPQAHCECVLTKLEGQVSEEDLFAADVADDVIDNLVNQCLAEVSFEGEWPEKIRQAFMDGCTSEATEEQCTCVMEKLEGEVSFNDVVNQKISDDKMNELIEACRADGTTPK